MLSENPPTQLKRELGWFGTAVMGLASAIGAGIFVNIGNVVDISGSAAIIALVVAGILATVNSLNIIQLAINHPVSGGIYEYGYKYLAPWLGFIGGWIYFFNRTAIAATAALGFSGYLLSSLGLTGSGISVIVAEIAVLVANLIVLGGIQRAKNLTVAITSITIGSLFFLIFVGLYICFNHGFKPLNLSINYSSDEIIGLLQSVALTFAFYNSADRIAMVGEEIIDPRKNIPKAVILVISLIMLIYIGVVVVGLGSIGAEALAEGTTVQSAPLRVVAESFNIPGASNLLVAGAITAMFGGLLMSTLGISRLLLAFGRRGDMPNFLTNLRESDSTPDLAVITAGIIIGIFVLTGDVKTTWALGTFGALCKSIIFCLAALQLSQQERLYPRWLTWLSLWSSLPLVFFLEWHYWLTGIGLIGIGLLWRFTFLQISRGKNTQLTLKDE
jgi:APA family basic amino acid/polyamine antiporter